MEQLNGQIFTCIYTYTFILSRLYFIIQYSHINGITIVCIISWFFLFEVNVRMKVNHAFNIIMYHIHIINNIIYYYECLGGYCGHFIITFCIYSTLNIFFLNSFTMVYMLSARSINTQIYIYIYCIVKLPMSIYV